jgi:hypothetical protein
MKHLIKYLGGALLMLNIGCAQEKKSEVPVAEPAVVLDCARSSACANGTPDAPGGSGSNGAGGFYSGSTVALTNVVGLGQMFYNSYPNQPTNIQINVDLNRTVDSIIVSYTDNGKVVEAGLGIQFPSGSRTDNKLNGWVTEGSSQVYKGFFQDKYGAIVIVIDKVLNTGDGTASALVGGSIYFQNFGDNPVYDSSCQSGDLRYGTCFVSQKMCWEISYGPYDCRTFIVGRDDSSNIGQVVPTSSSIPNNKGYTRTKSYVKLGDFTGLSRAAANLPTP